jgi:hypothetical protein
LGKEEDCKRRERGDKKSIGVGKSLEDRRRVRE